jgi:hypothetical protein
MGTGYNLCFVRSCLKLLCEAFVQHMVLIFSQEDAQLVKLVKYHGERNWATIAQGVPGRTGKSCRLRWYNQLSPSVNKEPFNQWEDAVLVMVSSQAHPPDLCCRSTLHAHTELSRCAARLHIELSEQLMVVFVCMLP